MFPTVVVDTAAVVMVKFADEAFAGIVTELGTDAAVLAFDKLTIVPVDGAAAVRVTVPAVFCPPGTLAGFKTSELKLGWLVCAGL
jgi:hypothetical protein